MPAPNNKILTNFEENIEKATLAAITAANIAGMRSTQEGEQPNFGVGIEFTLGAATGTMHRRPSPASPPRMEYSEYVGVLEVQLKANRPTVGASTVAGIDTAFGVALGSLRELFMESEWPLNDTNLPYYRLSLLRPAGTPRGVTQGTEQDIATLRFDVKFCIRPDAWPAAS